MSSITIKKLTPDDWEDFKSIRLESLSKHPEYFCPSRDEFAFQKEDWVERLQNKNGCSFGLYDGDQIIGLTGIIKEGNKADATKACLVSSYIREEYRKKGHSKFFYEARIAWAKARPELTGIVVEHRDTNKASHGAHQKFDFQFIGEREQVWPDGTKGICQIFELKL